jgi:hypothetical protein
MLVRLHAPDSETLWRYFFLTYSALLVNSLTYLRATEHTGALAVLFAGSVYILHPLFLLLPWTLLLILLNKALAWRDKPALRSALVYSASVVGTTLIQIFIFLDKLIFRLYGYHFNGFVWNLILTKGGLDSLGAGEGTQDALVLWSLGFLGLQSALLFVSIRVDLHVFRRKLVYAVVGIALALLAFEKIAFSISSYTSYTPVLAAADDYPLYVPCEMPFLGQWLGLKAPPRGVTLDSGSNLLRYPQNPIRRDPAKKLYNIVWLVSESLRADMLDPDIMPETSAFARRSARFRQHYSGGNGTRMGIFSMFYGLYGPYWFSFLHENRGPVLMDLLADEGYQFDLSTGANFTYPEFDKTVFVRVPAERMHENQAPHKWERDRDNVTHLLDFIDRRDRARPFMTYVFFESPHSRYSFPDETAIRKPYVDELNYLAMEFHKKDVQLTKNRYINACHYLDSQLGRIFEHLKQHELLESTVVLVTGDHGEEFMEKGRWGHNSDFSEEQTRVPMVIWAPGKPPSEDSRLTSHLDLPATLMTLLGVTNPPGEYSLGVDLFGDSRRSFTIVSDWNHLTYIDDQFKAELPLQTYDAIHHHITTKDDLVVLETDAFYRSRGEALVQLLKDLHRFQK